MHRNTTIIRSFEISRIKQSIVKIFMEQNTVTQGRDSCVLHCQPPHRNLSPKNTRSKIQTEMHHGAPASALLWREMPFHITHSSSPRREGGRGGSTRNEVNLIIADGRVRHLDDGDKKPLFFFLIHCTADTADRPTQRVQVVPRELAARDLHCKRRGGGG